jgi:7-cyano-7-deazaguanine synthase
MADAVILLSGGLDSYTTAAIARSEGFRLFALTLRYGQRHARELEAARVVASALQVERHLELDVDLSVFGGSSLTTDAPVPKDRPLETVTPCSLRWRSPGPRRLAARTSSSA